MGDELKRLAASDKTNILVVHDAIYIVESETGFSRLYAVVPAENAECYFVEFQKLYAGRTTAFDLTGRLKSVKTMIDKLGSLGLKPYAEYDRYLLKRRKTPKGFFRSMCSGENIIFVNFIRTFSKRLRMTRIFLAWSARRASGSPFASRRITANSPGSEGGRKRFIA